jgi:diguanylate cyclase (GGDEF)-like protein
VVSAVLRLAYFRGRFQQVDVGAHGVITFASTDGTILVRQPSLTAAGDIGLRLTNVPNFWRMVTEKTGVFTAPYSVDSVKRMRAFRQIGGLPLIIIVGLALDDIYAEWWRRAAWSIAVTSAVCLGILMPAWGFRRKLRRRELAEQDLAELATALSGMAVTDPLTGLGNRRHFDALLQREWRRAARSKSWVSLLMIDIDHFKAFNDHYGHQQGDEVLRILAKAISGSTRWPGDSGARYGGEEFAVVLPDTDLRGAMAVADNIRAAFIDREEAGELAAALPTISIGVSSVRGQRRDHAGAFRRSGALRRQGRRAQPHGNHRHQRRPRGRVRLRACHPTQSWPGRPKAESRPSTSFLGGYADAFAWMAGTSPAMTADKKTW